MNGNVMLETRHDYWQLKRANTDGALVVTKRLVGQVEVLVGKSPQTLYGKNTPLVRYENVVLQEDSLTWIVYADAVSYRANTTNVVPLLGWYGSRNKISYHFPGGDRLSTNPVGSLYST